MKFTFLLVYNPIVLIQFNLTFHLISNSFSISFNNEIHHVYTLLFAIIIRNYSSKNRGYSRGY